MARKKSAAPGPGPDPAVVEKLGILARQAEAGESSAEWFGVLLREAGWAPRSEERIGRRTGYTAAEIAGLFHVTPQAVGLWVRNEGCPRSADRTLDLEEVLRWWIHSRGDSLSSEEGKQLSAAKLKKAQHEAEILKIAESRKRLEYEAERALWLRREEVETGWAARARIVRDGLLRLAKELPPRLEHRPGREIQEVLERRMEDLLRKYAGEG